MKNGTAIGTVCAALLFLGGPAGAANPGAVAPQAQQAVSPKKINDPASILPQDAKKLMETTKGLLLIDVRSPLEFGQGHIEGSRNLPFIDILEGRHNLTADKPILLICSIGGRSFAAVQMLQEKGFKQVYNLDGGIEAWKRARYYIVISQ